jgi:hypothetical protein
MGPAQHANTSPSSSSIPLSGLSTGLSTSSFIKSNIMSTITMPPPTATSTTIKKLPANILCLKYNGSNWAIFKMCFSNAMKVTCRWAYFTGIIPCPEPIDAAQPTKEEATAIVQWEYEDSIVSYLLLQRLPDTTEMELANCTTTKE